MWSLSCLKQTDVRILRGINSLFAYITSVCLNIKRTEICVDSFWYRTQLSKLLELLLALRETQKREKERKRDGVPRHWNANVRTRRDCIFVWVCVCLWRGGERVCRVDKFEKEGTCWGKQPHTHSPVHTATADDVMVRFRSPREF